MSETKEIPEEVKKQAKEAHESNKCFTIKVSGNTYPIKDKLQSWGMFWVPEEKIWKGECCSHWQKFLFERQVADGDWPGVKLEATEEKPLWQ